MRSKSILVVSALLLVSASLLGEKITITTQSNGSLGYFGEGVYRPAVATLGQTFVIPDARFAILESVTLHLNPREALTRSRGSTGFSVRHLLLHRMTEPWSGEKRRASSGPPGNALVGPITRRRGRKVEQLC